jgi:hypothetical protein
MPDLSDEIKTFIVQSLACYLQPSQVVEAVKANFDVVVDRRQVQYYHPERGGDDKRLPDRWRNLFSETRRRYDSDIASIPISKLSYRLSRLQRMSEHAEDAGNLTLAADLLKQAAQDKGGVFTNRRKLDVTSPLQTLSDLLGVSMDDLPDELSTGERIN